MNKNITIEFLSTNVEEQSKNYDFRFFKNKKPKKIQIISQFFIIFRIFFNFFE